MVTVFLEFIVKISTRNIDPEGVYSSIGLPLVKGHTQFYAIYFFIVSPRSDRSDAQMVMDHADEISKE